MAKAQPHARPVRTVDVSLDLDGYDGITFTLRANPPMSWLDLQNEDPARGLRRAVRSLILKHNLADEQGKPVELDESASQLTSEEFWALLSAYNAKQREQAEAPKASGERSAIT